MKIQKRIGFYLLTAFMVLLIRLLFDVRAEAQDENEEMIWQEMGKRFLEVVKEGTLEEMIAQMKEYQGPYPTDIRFVIEPLQDVYQVNMPIKVKEVFSVINTNVGYSINVSGDQFDYYKFYLFDEFGIPLRKTKSVLLADHYGDPNWAPIGGPRGTGIGGSHPYKTELKLNDYVVVNKPGKYRLVGMRKWTWWEHDVSVSDIVPIRIVATNDVIETNSAMQTLVKPEDIWGNSYRGVELAVRPDKNPYILGKDIILEVLARNVGTNTMELKEEGTVFRDFRAMLFTSEGKYLFPKKWQWKYFPLSNNLGTPWPYFFKLKPGRVLKPGEETRYVVNLGEWYDITEAGTYYLLMMRRVTTWDNGFPVSNLVKLEVTAQSE